MIMAIFGGYLPISGHDHEQGLSDATAEARARVMALAASITPGA